jgi:hypothetical protein
MDSAENTKKTVKIAKRNSHNPKVITHRAPPAQLALRTSIPRPLKKKRAGSGIGGRCRLQIHNETRNNIGDGGNKMSTDAMVHRCATVESIMTTAEAPEDIKLKEFGGSKEKNGSLENNNGPTNHALSNGGSVCSDGSVCGGSAFIINSNGRSMPTVVSSRSTLNNFFV